METTNPEFETGVTDPIDAVVPVFSSRDPHDFQPPDSPNTYTIHPLNYRERVAFRADLTRVAGVRPSQDDYSNALGSALRELAPDNLDEALAILADADEARRTLEAAEVGTPEHSAALVRGQEAQARVNQLMVACMDVPVFADLRAAQEHWQGMAPYVAAKHSLRGSSGPDLPEFNRVRGVVPDALLEKLPPSELARVGWRAFLFVSVDRVASGNSAQP